MRGPCYTVSMKTGLLLIVMVVCAGVCMADPEPDTQRKFELTLGPDMTVFDGPLLPDGRVDYIAAMNAVMRKGVTHENNAFRAIFMLMPRDAELSDEVDDPSPTTVMMDLLDITPQAFNRVTPLVGLYAFGEAEGFTFDEMAEVEAAVFDLDFKHSKMAIFEKWIASQEPGLKKLVAAIHKPKYWKPWYEKLASPGSGQFALAPFVGEQRRLARMLDYRARYALSRGDHQVFLESLMAIYRLSDYTAVNPLLIDRLVANSMAFLANDLLHVALRDHRLDGDELTALQRFFDQRPSRLSMSEVASFGERIYGISFFLAMASGKDSFGRMFGEAFFLDPVDSSAFDRAIEKHGVDLESGLRLIATQAKLNRSAWESDTLVEYLKKRDVHENLSKPRREAIKENIEEAEDGTRRIKVSRAFQNPAALAEMIIELPSVLMGDFWESASLGPAIYSSEARSRVGQTALALTRYRLDHGKYPKRLKDLLPKYCQEISLDPIDGEPLRYRLDADGSAVIYSIHINLKDDGGTADPDDSEAVRDGDYVWKLPLPAE